MAPIPTGTAPGMHDGMEIAPKAVAAAGIMRAGFYSGYHGLVQPMKSTIYSAIRAEAISASRAVEEVGAEAAVGAVAAHALWNEGSAAYRGECF